KEVPRSRPSPEDRSENPEKVVKNPCEPVNDRLSWRYNRTEGVIIPPTAAIQRTEERKHPMELLEWMLAVTIIGVIGTTIGIAFQIMAYRKTFHQKSNYQGKHRK
ncbi:hypothetical protein, partial [Nocardiopsis lucentensis]|uniref:hypothetical protein n=1 Tax=Nocardiopsis lucentensis TaxID=53441 RepID=UPI0019D3C9AA